VIAAEDRRKLVRFLGMLGSEHDGEVVNAARIALRLMKDRGFTWDQILAPAAPEIYVPPPEPERPRAQKRAQPKPRQPQNPWSFVANDLLAAFMKKKRVAADDLALVNRALSPLYFPTKDEANRLEVLFVAEFGKGATWSKAS
jgi:hypothetical protein